MALLGFNDPAAAAYVGVIPAADFERSWQLLLPDGRRLQSGAASVEVLTLIPATRWLGLVVSRLHLTGLVGLVYGGISRSRGWLGKLVRDAPGPQRVP